MPAFRLFVVGQGISVVGTWMQQIATVWLVCRLSNSSLLLGVADFSAQIPAALILPPAGVLTDRWNRHRTVLATQALAMLQAFALMALTATGLISVWQILLLGTFLGLVSAFDVTARQSFVIQMVERHEDLAIPEHCRGAPNRSLIVTSLLDGPVPAMAAIVGRGGGFINQVKVRPDVEILAMTTASRNRLPDELARPGADDRDALAENKQAEVAIGQSPPHGRQPAPSGRAATRPNASALFVFRAGKQMEAIRESIEDYESFAPISAARNRMTPRAPYV